MYIFLFIKQLLNFFDLKLEFKYSDIFFLDL